MDPERRIYQRLHLTRPLDGWFGDYAVQLRDISATGALVETQEEIPLASRALLRFYWHDHEVEIMAETVRNEFGQSGLQFIEDSEHLRQLIIESASKVLRAQQANAEGNRELNIVHGDETITAASAATNAFAYLMFTFHDGVWKQRKCLLPDQPEDGFTVAVGESPEQIALLCRTYEAGDQESRRMTRLLAELSALGHHGDRHGE